MVLCGLFEPVFSFDILDYLTTCFDDFVAAVASTGKPFHHYEQCKVWYSFTGLPESTCSAAAASLTVDTEFGKVEKTCIHKCTCNNLDMQTCTQSMQSLVHVLCFYNSRWRDKRK